MDSEMEEKKESLLIQIRSVVQSAKGGVLLNQLPRDYKILVGGSIPFETFGYKSLEAFVFDAPHFFSTKRTSRGELYLEAVADSSTAHLSKLIANQKKSKSTLVSPPQSSLKSLKKVKVTQSSSVVQKNVDRDLRMQLEKEKESTQWYSSQCVKLNEQLKTAQDALKTEKFTVERLMEQMICLQKESGGAKDLKVKLEKEMKLTKLYSSENERLNLVLKTAQASLKTEKETVEKLNEQIKASQAPPEKEKNKKDEQMKSLMKANMDLINKLTAEKEKNQELSSRVLCLESLVKQSKESVNKEELHTLNSSRENGNSLPNQNSSDSWGESLLNLLETDAAKQLNASSNTPKNGQNQLLNFFKMYEQRMYEQMQKFEIQLNAQNEKLMSLSSNDDSQYPLLDALEEYEQRTEEKLEKLEKQLKSQSIRSSSIEKVQNRHYQLLDSRIKKCEDTLQKDNLNKTVRV